jgi:acetyl-CoA synthetase
MNIIQYRLLQQKAQKNSAQFWYDLALEQLYWDIPPSKSVDSTKAPFYTWFDDGELSISYNCLDKHMHNGNSQKTALIFEDDAGNIIKISYEALLIDVCRMCNYLKQQGFKAGERAIIYMPMCIQAIVAMHACVRLGIIHSVVFAGFSAQSLQERIIDAGASLIFTADIQYRGGKKIAVKQNVDNALALGNCNCVREIITYQRSNTEAQIECQIFTHTLLNIHEILWHDAIKNQDDFCAAIPFNAEHPLFILYTSGSTGKPKGVQHASAGYLLNAMLSMQWTFDIQNNDIFWCTADIGWITGHTYVAYGPMAMGATQLIFEGVPTYPNADRCWHMIEKHKVSIFYTAPTAIRALRARIETPEGQIYAPHHFNLASLRLLGTVGEPINPEAWQWYYDKVGKNNCFIVDTWWQTETGAHMLTPLVGIHDLKAGSCAQALPGIDIDIVNAQNQPVKTNEQGYLVIRQPWPSMIRTIWNDAERFKNTYFPQQFGGNTYLAGDGAYQDNDGYFWIVGRIDDVINVSGHRLGTIEIESALVAHNLVAEAAVVSVLDDITGEAIVAFVSIKAQNANNLNIAENMDINLALELELTLKNWVSQHIGALAKPKHIIFIPSLPKTRSGKIMRRLLRSIARKEKITQDISTLENADLLHTIINTLYKQN